jgi:putative thioredoxin
VERSTQVPVLVDVTADWCGPCRTLGPILERLAEEHRGGFVLAKLDFDRNPRLAMQMGVDSIPAVFAFQGGRVAGRFLGALPEQQVRAFLARILPSATDRMLQQAQALLETRPQEALELLDSAARDQPGNEDIAALRAWALLRVGRDAESRKLAEQVSEASPFAGQAANILATLDFREQAKKHGGTQACRDRARTQPGDLQRRYELGICLAAEANYDEALQELMAVAEANPSEAAGRVKEAMVKIFGLLGPESELADEYRRRLAAVLY